MNPFNITIDPSWSANQIKRFNQIAKHKTMMLAYWNSDEKGFPCNGGKSNKAAAPGLIEEIKVKFVPCSKYALHATDSPHAWTGEKIWVVAVSGRKKIISEEDNKKIACTKREIIGEVNNFNSLSFINILYKGCIRNIDYLNQDYDSIFLEYVSFLSCDFENCKLSGTVAYTSFINCHFINSNLCTNNCQFNNCLFKDAKFNYLANCYFNGCTFPKSFDKKLAIKNGCAFVKCKFV